LPKNSGFARVWGAAVPRSLGSYASMIVVKNRPLRCYKNCSAELIRPGQFGSTKCSGEKKTTL